MDARYPYRRVLDYPRSGIEEDINPVARLLTQMKLSYRHRHNSQNDEAQSHKDTDLGLGHHFVHSQPP